MADDPFLILGVPSGADLGTCRAAYRALAKRHHPDRGGDAATFARVGRAWAEIQKLRPAPGVTINQDNFMDVLGGIADALRKAPPRKVRFNGKIYEVRPGDRIG